METTKEQLEQAIAWARQTHYLPTNVLEVFNKLVPIGELDKDDEISDVYFNVMED